MWRDIFWRALAVLLLAIRLLPIRNCAENGPVVMDLIPEAVRREQQLIDRCLGGDAAAWSELFAYCHAGLQRSIRAFLGRAGSDASLIDEISARVWYGLVRNEFELLARFDPNRGCRFITFLAALAKAETRVFLRSERRRKTREHFASRPEVAYRTISTQLLSQEEFLATLTPSERLFFDEVLTAVGSDDAAGRYSKHNQWQLRHRVRKKMILYFGEATAAVP